MTDAESQDYRSVLITGGAGFVGSNLSLHFKQTYDGARVFAADNLRRRGSEAALPRLRAGGIEYVHCDIRNAEDMRFDGHHFDLIVDCSAEPSVLAGYADAPDYLINTNLLGTVHCLELARRCSADLIFLSTSRVYPIPALNRIATTEAETRFLLDETQEQAGVSAAGISERFTLDGPRSLYGTTKLCSELLIGEYGAMYGVRTIINRCGVLTGPWQMGKIEQGVFALWVAMHHFSGQLTYIGWGGEGKQVRDLLHIDDLADLLTIQLRRFGELNGSIFNVGGGTACSLSLLETTRLCEEITSHSITIRHIPDNRPGDLKLYITDNGRVTAATGWKPRRGPKEILTDIHRWIAANERELRHIWVS